MTRSAASQRPGNEILSRDAPEAKAGLSAVRPAGADERGEDFPLHRVAMDEKLGMPLHAHYEAVRDALDAFDDAVLGGCVDDESFTRRLHRLVVCGVDFQTRLADDLAQLGSLVNHDRVPAAAFELRALVLDWIGILRVDVLIERAAERNVDRLRAAADAEQRHVARERKRDQAKLEFRALFLYVAQRGYRSLTVKFGMNVEVAAAHHEAVERFDHGPHGSRRRQGRKDQGHAAG